MEKSFNNKIKGFGLIEVLVSLAIASIVLLAFTSLNNYNIKISRASTTKLKAEMYLQELIEVAKDLEESDWNEIITAPCLPDCHPQIQGNAWTLAAGPETLDNSYTRSIEFKEVRRDPITNEIVASGGVIDPDTKNPVAQIAWNDGFGDKTMTLETYIYNY